MQMYESIAKKYWLTLVFLALMVSFSFQGSRGLYETTEGRYAECAREMIESGNYLEPTVGHRPHWTKPPLTYWAITGGIKLLGPNEWGVRLYNAIAFFFTVLAVTYLGVTIWGKATGLVAGLIYASSPFPVFGAYAISTDTLLTLWEVGAVLCYIKAYRSLSLVERKTWIVMMWVFLGFGFVTKGPPALIPFIPILVWHFRHKNKPTLANPLGIVLFILVGFSWYLLVCFRHPGLWSYFLGHEVVGRIASNSVHNYEWYKPFTIYVPLLTLGAGPWLYFGLKMVWQKRLLRPKVLWSHLKSASNSTFLLLWLVLPLTLLSLVKSRLELYVLPLYGPIALATARGICQNGPGSRIMRRVAIVAVCTGFVLGGAKGLTSCYPNKKNMKFLYEMCRRVSRDNTKFVVFNGSQLYGLQYYLNGDLRTISITGEEPWADDSIQYAIRKMKGLGSSTSYGVISDKKEAPMLCSILRGSGVRYKRFDNRWWTICLVEGGALLSDESL